MPDKAVHAFPDQDADLPRFGAVALQQMVEQQDVGHHALHLPALGFEGGVGRVDQQAQDHGNDRRNEARAEADNVLAVAVEVLIRQQPAQPGTDKRAAQHQST